MIERILHDNWTMHRIGEKEWIPAVVPGSVYGDLLREGRMEDPFWKDNEWEKSLILPVKDSHGTVLLPFYLKIIH